MHDCPCPTISLPPPHHITAPVRLSYSTGLILSCIRLYGLDFPHFSMRASNIKGTRTRLRYSRRLLRRMFAETLLVASSKEAEGTRKEEEGTRKEEEGTPKEEEEEEEEEEAAITRRIIKDDPGYTICRCRRWEKKTRK